MKEAILLINLGSPNSPSVKDVRSYLSEFLMDKRVINIPYIPRFLLVKGIIANFRSPKSAQAYQKVWTKKGSPLIVHTRELAEKLEPKLNKPVYIAMRYAEPSIKKTMTELAKKDYKKIKIVPLYPQYAMATTETVVEKVKEVTKAITPKLELEFVPPFFNQEAYINSLAKSITDQVNLSKIDKLVFSYHGVPHSHIKQTNPSCTIDEYCCSEKREAHKTCYRHQCFETTRKVVEKLELKEEKYLNCFQSRLGRQKWLEPFTSETVKKLALEGNKSIAIITPAFVSDCLETIEEIGIEAKELFLENGGKEFYRIECLNSEEHWVESLGEIIK